jgi:glycosyltransferase 2 family protein
MSEQAERTPPHTETVEVVVKRGKYYPLWFALKAAISLGLIIVVLRRVDFVTTWENSRQLSGTLIASIVIMFAAQTYVAAWRWWVILRHHHIDIGLFATVRICLIGAFFNQLLPTSFGGDVARAWYVYRSGFGRKISVISVLSDRIYGMLTLACLAIILFPVLLHFSVSGEALIVVGALSTGASLALMAAFWLDCLPGWARRWAIIRHLGSLSAATRALMMDKRAVLPLLGLSFLVHAITVLAILVLLAAVAPHVNLLLCAALVPVIMLMVTVPISIAGWGVRESIMIYGLGLANVRPEAALIVSIMVGLSLAAVGLLGGVTWFIRVNRDRPSQSVA